MDLDEVALRLDELALEYDLPELVTLSEALTSHECPDLKDIQVAVDPAVGRNQMIFYGNGTTTTATSGVRIV